MSLLALAAAAALSLVDPTGDAAGDGTLEPPTSPIYANAALFDLQELSITPGAAEDDPGTMRVAMGAVEVDESQPGGFNRAVVDVYLDFAEGGATATLQGPGMLMPPGRGWDYAVRITPRGAFGSAAPLGEEQTVQWSPLDMSLDGDVFVVSLPSGIGSEVEAYAMSGVYDAFSPDGWRPLAKSPSPWSYSGTEQSVPVIDLMAPDHETQMRALRDGVLPASARHAAEGLGWILLSMAGVLIAATGLWFRRLVRADGEAPPDAAAQVGVAEEVDADEVDAEEVGGDEVEAQEVVAAEEAGAEGVDGEEVDAEGVEAEEVAVEEAVVEGVAADKVDEDVEPEPAASGSVTADAADYTGLEAADGDAVEDGDAGSDDRNYDEVTAEEDRGPDAAEPDVVEPDQAEADATEEVDAFGRVGRDLSENDDEEVDDLLGFTDRRGRSLRVEHTDDPAGQEDG